MAKVILDRHCREIESGGRVYRARDGVFNVPDRVAKAVTREGGAIASMTGVTSREIGYSCIKCGFASYFVLCSRCGGNCEKDQ